MPKFNVTVPHDLSEEEARQRLDHLLDAVRDKFQDQVSDLEQSWQDDKLHFGFKTYGIKLSGVASVTDNDLTVDGELPFSAMMFKGKIESGIREHLAKILA